MTREEVSEALAELIKDRASRGNCQSKHGTEAAESFELFHVMRRLDELIGVTP